MVNTSARQAGDSGFDSQVAQQIFYLFLGLLLSGIATAEGLVPIQFKQSVILLCNIKGIQITQPTKGANFDSCEFSCRILEFGCRILKFGCRVLEFGCRIHYRGSRLIQNNPTVRMKDNRTAIHLGCRSECRWNRYDGPFFDAKSLLTTLSFSIKIGRLSKPTFLVCLTGGARHGWLALILDALQK